MKPSPSSIRSRSRFLPAFAVLLGVLPAIATEPARQASEPTGVPADWWSRVQRSIQLEEYGVVEADDAGQAFRAGNPAHRFDSRFDGHGLRLTGRGAATREAGPRDDAAWEWGLTLTGWGRPGALDAAEVGWLSPDEDRVTLDRGALTEWFVNRPGGLEHGFTVPVPPRGDGDRLVFDLALTGDLRPVFSEDGQAIDFYSSGNVGVLRYAKLVVTDAGGAVLPSRFEPLAQGIRIAVDDTAAVYPLTVDPLATSAIWTGSGDEDVAWFGYSVATAGDVNGDGHSDLVVGAYRHDAGGGASANRGRAYLYLGSASGPATSAAWTGSGDEDDAFFGISVATAGDVNGDGYSDVVVGARLHDAGAGLNANRGRAYLYLGSASGLAVGAAWTGSGDENGAFFGTAVATAGDVNGDGYSDVVVGAWGHDAGAGMSADRGQAYLYLGSASGLATDTAWTGSGDEDFAEFGYTVATAGDVNGDGYSDVVVGAHGDAVYRGGAYLYLGSAAGLATSAAWTGSGDENDAEYGISVATAGDVNGDGYSDVVVGALFHDAGAGLFADRGRAYLYLGSGSGLAMSAAWTGSGDEDGASLGISVATAGDVNGDGYSDVVVGANGHDAGAGLNADRGQAYLYLGSASGLGTSAVWTGSGDENAAVFGISVVTAGDVNGDGYSDLVAGSYLHDAGAGLSADRGQAYVYLGSASGLATGADWTGSGDEDGASFGYSVAPAGDVNGDGYSDVVVGARWHDAGAGPFADRGRAFLYLGSASGLATGAAWTGSGDEDDAYFGVSVATAGDVNGDGYSDVVVGAWGHDAGAGLNANRGRVYLYLGSASGLATGAAWTGSGDENGARFGHSVATAGDVNGDGYSEVVVGALFHDAGSGLNADRGRAYLYLGSASGLATSAAWTGSGDENEDEFGNSVATAGDVNGDGYSDIVVGVHGDAANRGRAYLYLGSASGLATGAAWTGSGDENAAEFGISVATAGDVNGDGYSDVVVGADLHDAGAGGGANRGRAYLYLGSASGLAAGAAWTGSGDEDDGSFGISVASAGDVNGDGYSDVIVGADLHDAGVGGGANRGRAYLYLGSASGLATNADWTGSGDENDAHLGTSVAPAGDVNGDGYSDVVVGADGHPAGGGGNRGRAYIYSGGGGAGVPLVPRQSRTDLSAPIHPGGPAFEQEFRLGLTLRSPAGRARRKLQWQVEPWGGVFSPAFTPIQSDSFWYGDTVAPAVLVPLSLDQERYVWRARVKYHAAQSPFLPASPWFTISGNGLHEADVLSTSRVAPPPCVAPDEELYITTVNLDGNGKPVIDYQDPNQPSSVTGYNVYRAGSPTGPWVLLGSNVVDMDEGTPNIQYVDQTGDVGGPWYYEVAAWNGACGEEGPR